jgi:tripartite-type tricarboxylate transporter receptor subunit TctC
MKMISSAALALAALLCQTPAQAQAFPNKPVTVYVPWSAGGGGDTMARAVSTRLSTLWGQQVVVENRPGGAGVIATQAMLKAPADGYSILFTAEPIPAINPHVIARLPYKQEDLTPVTAIVTLPQVLIVSTANPHIQTLPSLVNYARANPGKLSYGSFGPGSTPQIVMEMFKDVTKTDIVDIPYKGAAPAMTDVGAGTLDMTVTGPSGARAMVQAGRAKIIGVAVRDRVKAAPDAMTFREAGIQGADYTSFLGFMVRAGTPQAVIDKIARDVKTVVSDPAFVQASVTPHSYEAVGSTPAEFDAMIKKMSTDAARIVKSLGIVAQ